MFHHMATDQMKMGSDGEFFTGNLFPPEMQFPTAFKKKKKNPVIFLPETEFSVETLLLVNMI